MVKKIGFLFLLGSMNSSQAMDQQPNIVNFSSTSMQGCVIKKTGLGASATTELIHDPMMADMMQQMRVSEAACYARQAQQAAEKKAVQAKKDETSFGSGFGKGFFDKKSKSSKN